MTWTIYLLTVILAFPLLTYGARFIDDVTTDRLINIAAISLIPFLNIIFAVVALLVAFLDHAEYWLQKRIDADKVLFKKIGKL